jgi:hypothetical protein
VLTLAAVGACALTAPAQALTADLPPIQQSGKASFITGGVGQEELSAMQQAEGKYPLAIEFAAHTADGRNEFIANEHVQVRDSAGRTVIDTNADGPLVLAKVPAGKYRIDATKHQAITLKPGQHEHVVMSWNNPATE